MAGFDNRTVTDRSDMEVKATAEVMLYSNQPHVIGILYGTHCSQPHLVPIPILNSRRSDADLTELTLDSLFVECWVPHTRSQKYQDRITETTLPEDSMFAGHSGESTVDRTLPEPFTVYFTNQDEWKAQKRNEVIARIVYQEQEHERGRRSRDQAWYGPILVVKHSKGTEEPVNALPDDVPMVWELLKQAMKRYHLREHNRSPSLDEQQWG